MGTAAQVVRVSGPTATVDLAGRAREARIPPSLPGRPLAVGDLVLLRHSGDEVVIEEVAPRRTVLERAQGMDGPRRPIVANADLLVVVEALASPDPRPMLIDHYLVAADVGGLEAAVVFTKADLAPPGRAAELMDLYAGLRYPVLAGNATDPDLAEALRAVIAGRVAALVGQSGVGKSTLTRWLTGVERAVGEVSDRVGGRHTTTDPRLIPLPGDGAIVDTAGVRNLFLPQMDAVDVADAFPEIRALADACRFRDCRHMGETGCAVEGTMAPTRVTSYRRLMETVARRP